MKRKIKQILGGKCSPLMSEKGFAILEAGVALVLLGGVALVFIYGIATAFKANLVADNLSEAQAIAQSQIEYLKNSPYVYANAANNYAPTYSKINIPAGYSINSKGRDGNTTGNITGVPWYTGNTQTPTPTPLNTPVPTASPDPSLQKITLVIKQGNQEILTLETYKVNR